MNKKLLLLLVTHLFVSAVVHADVPTKQVKEVKHLLSFVRDSGCIINRNGSEYPSAKGVKHIQRKYDYFRDDIKSTEDFIELAATKSTMSGKYYTVTCPDKEAIKTQDWLLTELKRFRTN